MADAHTKLPTTPAGRRRIDVDFSAGRVSSDGGLPLLRELDIRHRLCERLAACFVDHRNPDLVEHSVEQMLRQRLFGLVLGYEDLNDHETLSRDPLIATMLGKADPLGATRRRKKDRGVGAASPSTLGRLERTKAHASPSSRYDKLVCDFDALRDVFVDVFIQSFKRAPAELVIDLDPSDIEIHGQQEGRFFHGYYDHHCYLPMYIYCGQLPLAVKLRRSDIDGAHGSVEMLAPIVTRIRESFPKTRLIIRGDSGFCREDLMAWCESKDVHFIFGIARNPRLEKLLEPAMKKAKAKHERTGRSARVFASFQYRTLQTWSRTRRVVGKAEYLDKGPNPRFIVTSLPGRYLSKKRLYEELYCARGEMENRIKEQQLDLFGARTSCTKFRANHVRLWLSLAAHLLVVLLRKDALHGTELANAQASTLRLKLLKIGALVTVSVRRLHVRLSSAFPLQELMALAMSRLRSV